MNLIEAVMSQKPYRRKNWATGVWYPSCSTDDLPYMTKRFSYEDIIADDWQIEEPAITVTRSEVIEAWVKALKIWGARREYSDESITPIEELLKELGFPE
jgi:hypothetical protein